MKNQAFVGQPILAAAVFQAALSSLRASLAEGTGGVFSTLLGWAFRPRNFMKNRINGEQEANVPRWFFAPVARLIRT
jgi:hypothetical protein